MSCALWLAQVKADDRLLLQEPLAPLSAAPQFSPSKVKLGERLFNDPALSGKERFACRSCHDLKGGGTINMARTVGYEGRIHRFNAPTVFNVGNNYRLGWRGEFTSLEQQNEAVLLDENLMAANWKTLLLRLKTNAPYVREFKIAFGRLPDRPAVLEALAMFQRSLVTPNAPFDRYLNGDTDALSKAQVEGYHLFKRYGCASCHQGSNIGGNMFQKFGVFTAPDASQTDGGEEGDLGRWTITGAHRDRGVFRVPSLRNVDVTPPYFHDGRVETLAEAVVIMAQSQLGQDLPPADVSSIVAFLKALTGEYNGQKLSSSPLQNVP